MTDSMRRGLNRGDFLKLSGLAGLGLAFTGCGGSSEDDGPLTFSFGENPAIEELIARFDERSGARAEYRRMPTDSNAYFSQMLTEFQAGGGDTDVIASDTTWPAQFAANGYLTDLSDRLTDEQRVDFLPATLRSVEIDDGLFGVPFQLGVGMLFYRSDLLENAGYSEPPRTWDELREMARRVQESEGTRYGYVFQGARYEGGTVNGLEFIWNAGGDVLSSDDPEEVVIGSDVSVEGLTQARNMISDGISPEATTTYTESESLPIFMRGDAVFLRFWPDAYGYLGNPEETDLTREQVSVASLPTLSEDIESSGCLGGWSLAVNEATPDPDAAWELARFMTSEESLKYRTLEAGFLPTRESLLFDDPEIRERVPVVVQGADAIRNARPRPVSAYYNDLSLKMSEVVNNVLSGETEPARAVETLQNEIQEIVDQS